MIKSLVGCKTNHPFSLREKARMRGYKVRQHAMHIDPLSPTLSLGEREYTEQP
jgi:hypothetical protein